MGVCPECQHWVLQVVQVGVEGHCNASSAYLTDSDMRDAIETRGNMPYIVDQQVEA